MSDDDPRQYETRLDAQRSAERASQSDRVDYHFTCDGVADRYQVVRFDGIEELGRPYQFTVRLACLDEQDDPAELLGRDVQLQLQRGQHERHFCGIVNRLVVGDASQVDRRTTVEVEVVPALSALALTRTTRIFQEKTALQILEEVLRESLQPYRRELDAGLLATSTFAVRDFCVQYQESNFDFVHRLMEEEGIGYYFDHEERERLVLFDDSRRLSAVETLDGGPVRFDDEGRTLVDAEPIVRFRPSKRLTSNAITVRDHDWTRGRPTVEHAIDGEARGHRHEVYEHGLARHLTITEDHGVLSTLAQTAQNALIANLPVTGFGLGGVVGEVAGTVLGDFTSNDAEHQTRIRRELALRDAQAARGASKVTGFSPGRRFELVGHHKADVDGEYFLTKVEHTSDAERYLGDAIREGIDYANRFECAALATPWRPDRRTRKPRIHGVQTARVTGPAGMDVHTDHFGRIKAKFNWDRDADSPAGNHSCWLRVSQPWAGQGSPGIVFTPRVGMEVVVSFVDGDPDRPLVTGCVYNGANPAPTILPFQATKSIIRTRTVPHGPGHNEISFEDAMGMERVHIRAERDLDELVLHDHQTHVTNNQLNVVGGDHREEVVGHQMLHVNGHRAILCGGDERHTTGSNHSHDIAGSSHVRIHGHNEVRVYGGSMLTETTRGEFVVLSRGRLILKQNAERRIIMASTGDDKGIRLEGDGALIRMSENRIELSVGGSSLVITPDRIQANDKMIPALPSPEPPRRTGGQP